MISLSWGFPDDRPHLQIESALQNAHNKNIVILAAAANHGRMNQIAFPARLRDYVICIGAARRDGTIAGFTTEDAHFQGFTAPGVGVCGASVGRMSSWRGDRTERKDGTSSATPTAAGVAARRGRKSSEYVQTLLRYVRGFWRSIPLSAPLDLIE